MNANFWDLNEAEKAGMAVWNNGGSVDDRRHALSAIREAVRVANQINDRSDDYRIATLEKAVQDIAGMIDRFDTPADAGRVRAFVGDLAQILQRIP